VASFVQDVRVNHGRLHVLVSQQLLHSAYVVSLGQALRRFRLAIGVSESRRMGFNLLHGLAAVNPLTAGRALKEL
jgi:hypothetical protein